MFPENNKESIPEPLNGFLSKKAYKSDLSRNVNIRIEKSVWTALKKLKSENETFNDVVLKLLKQRSIELSTSSMGAIQYSRKTNFVSVSDSLGFQFEYNDIKSLSKFNLDLKIKKVYYGKQIYNPSFFFGLSNELFFYSENYLKSYFILLASILVKEFNIRANIHLDDLFNLVVWRKVYFDYGLSEESFIEDIQQPLERNETEKLSKKIEKDINDSISSKLEW